MILQKEIALVSRVCIYIITRKDVINSCVSKFLEFRYRSGENGATVLYCTMYHVMCTMYQFYFNKFWLRCRLNLLFNDNSLIFLKNVQIFKVFFSIHWALEICLTWYWASCLRHLEHRWLYVGSSGWTGLSYFSTRALLHSGGRPLNFPTKPLNFPTKPLEV